MMIVIQCAARKRPDAGRMRTMDGQVVEFVANPAAAPERSGCIFARPDDAFEEGFSWRQGLLAYNSSPGDNPLGLLPAYRLYENPTYGRLVERYGEEKVFILSAGWGLLPATFLTPHYDITFTLAADAYKRRRPGDVYDDFTLPGGTPSDHIVFFGGRDYIPLFLRLTDSLGVERTVFYNSERTPEAPGCSLRRFETRTRTNWHYECVRALLSGRVSA